MTYEQLINRANNCLSDQVTMYLSSECFCGGNKKPKLFIPKKPYSGLFISCDECEIEKKLLLRELTVKEYFVIDIL